ncbi:MAG: hypothetical protein ABEJ68_08400 [Halobacteriaceae archaeon]
MVEYQTIGIVVLVFIALAVGIYFLRRRLSDGDENDDEQRLEQQQRARRSRDNSLPVTKRVGGWTWPTKWLVGGILVVFTVVTWNIYTYLKTGSPTQMAYAQETQLFVAGLVTFAGGIWYDRRLDRRSGTIHVRHESDPDEGSGETTETIHYHPDDVIEDEHGMVVAEYTRTRRFGLFRQPKRVADDRRLRNDGDVHRPLSDKVYHRLPDHAVQVGRNEWVVRTQGVDTSSSPTAVADYEYRPPFSLSRERLHQIHADMDQMQSEVKQKNRILADRDAKIRELEQMLKNARTDDWRQFLDILRELAPYIGGGQSNEQILQKLPDDAFKGHSSRDTAGNGEENGELTSAAGRRSQ